MSEFNPPCRKNSLIDCSINCDFYESQKIIIEKIARRLKVDPQEVVNSLRNRDPFTRIDSDESLRDLGKILNESGDDRKCAKESELPNSGYGIGD